MLLNANNSIKLSLKKSSIIKSFPVESNNSKLRFNRELEFYKYCQQINFEHCPKLIGFDYINQTLEISYVNGKSPNIGKIEDLDNFCSFIKLINSDELPSLPRAADSFFSISEFSLLIKQRRQTINQNNCVYMFDEHKLDDFVNDVLFLLSRTDFECQTRVVNPSDLGLHNYLVNKSCHSFVDFEYAGIDSIPKLVYDFTLHPRNRFDGISIQEIFDYIGKSIEPQPEFKSNLICIFSVWWMLRLLNSLRSDVIEKKLKSGVLNKKTIGFYIEERANNLRRFKKMYYEFR